MADPFIGEIKILPYTFAPRSWASCDGQLLPISQNTALFAILGTTFGGDGRSTLGLPNLQGRAPMHPGRGPGLTPRRLGERVGSSTVVLDEAEIPSHNHRVAGVRRIGTADTPDNTMFPATDADIDTHQYIRTDANLSSMASSSLAISGGGQAHENRQPSLVMQFCIALDGLFPSRN
ncbi:phage tail protein [Aliikangiella coralliicola]|uniref:Phage tail protein n=1 Tax=Aliikangiella coralliicola TaxID=2592383 RepID=A0A545U7B2_9GAMM|nr:tail fiber protein [Aliikangiella coralliicola]TQV85344.1 phage tail protein [Aliikangiella coralliicola]